MTTNSYDYIFKVLLLGDSGVGKSSTLLRFVDEEFNNTRHSTIGVEFASKIINYQDNNLGNRFGFENKKIKLQIWDTAGQEKFRSVTKSYFRGTAGVIMVFDITDRASFESLKYWLKELEQVRGSIIDSALLEEDAGFIQKEPKITYSKMDYSKMEYNKMDYSKVACNKKDHKANYSRVEIDTGWSEDDDSNLSGEDSEINYDISENSQNCDDLVEYPSEICTSSESESVEEVSKEKELRPELLDPVEFSHVRYPPIILVGNKADLSMNDRVIYPDEAIKFGKENHFDYYTETSALTGNNVENVFNNLAKTIYLNVKKRGTGLDGVISSKNRNPTWYELEAYRQRNGSCSC